MLTDVKLQLRCMHGAAWSDAPEITFLTTPAIPYHKYSVFSNTRGKQDTMILINILRVDR